MRVLFRFGSFSGHPVFHSDELFSATNFKLMFLVPPTFADEQPRNTSVILNAAIDLECRPELAVPMPTITWYKNDRQLQRYETNSVIVADGTRLQIRNTQLGDSAIYTCVATNLVGNSTRTFYLEVHSEFD